MTTYHCLSIRRSSAARWREHSERAAERLLALGLLLASTLVAAAEPPPADEEFLEVQPGDTCPLVAKRVWGKPETYRQLHELNAMKNSHPPLVPGTRLRIRPAPEAHLTYVKPDVKTRPPEEPTWKPGRQGEALYRLYQVNTLRGAGAEVTMKDTSKLQLRENALVVIYGTQPASSAQKQPAKSGGVELVQGDLRMRLAALRGEPLPLETPAAQVEATGQELFVGVDEQHMSRVAVFQGRAQVAAKGARVEVPGGKGTRVEKGKEPEPPRLLLPAPGWTGGLREVVLALGGAPHPYTLQWRPVPGAVSYQVVLARDEAFNDAVAEAAPTAGAAQALEAGALPPGRYYARVHAVDEVGLPGMPSAPRNVEVLAVKVERGEVGGLERVTGRGQVKLVVDPASGLPLRVKGKPVGSEAVLLAPGLHTVDVEGAARPVSVEILPAVNAELVLRPEAGRFKLEVTARLQEAGAPPIADGALQVRGLEGASVSNLVRQGETRWTADVTPVRAGGVSRAAVEIWVYGEPAGRTSAEAKAD